MDHFHVLEQDFHTHLREKAYHLVAEQFHIRSAIYPGAGRDIIPSLSIPSVVYLEESPLYADFYQNTEQILNWLEQRKKYGKPCSFTHYAVDYRHAPALGQFDLLLSQYAGDVSQCMKAYLKSGGILLAAEGPEDVRLAMNDPDYELIGTINFEDGKAELHPGLLPASYFEMVPENEVEPVRIPVERQFCFRKRT